jgi:hypothetical protein
MAFTVEEFQDLIRLLQERPEWRADLRRLVLTDELLALPELSVSWCWHSSERRGESDGWRKPSNGPRRV